MADAIIHGGACTGGAGDKYLAGPDVAETQVAMKDITQFFDKHLQR